MVVVFFSLGVLVFFVVGVGGRHFRLWLFSSFSLLVVILVFFFGGGGSRNFGY